MHKSPMAETTLRIVDNMQFSCRQEVHGETRQPFAKWALSWPTAESWSSIGTARPAWHYLSLRPVPAFDQMEWRAAAEVRPDRRSGGR